MEESDRCLSLFGSNWEMGKKKRNIICKVSAYYSSSLQNNAKCFHISFHSLKRNISFDFHRCHFFHFYKWKKLRLGEFKECTWGNVANCWLIPDHAINPVACWQTFNHQLSRGKEALVCRVCWFLWCQTPIKVDFKLPTNIIRHRVGKRCTQILFQATWDNPVYHLTYSQVKFLPRITFSLHGTEDAIAND